MVSRRGFLAGAAGVAAFAQTGGAMPLGLQIYSLRREAAKDLPGTLALTRRMGFETVEMGDLFGRSAAEFRQLLDDTGLRAVSMMAAFERLDNEIDKVIEEARAVGVEYVVCSTIPHRTYLTVEECDRAAEALDRFGESLAKADLRGCYHIHGTEFEPHGDGTVFDRLVQRTDPKYTNYEMDIFWVVYARHDPVKFLHRYPGRFPLTHVKDLRKGIELNLLPRDVREEDSVVFGTGLVDIPAAMQAARETGVQHHFLEDEAVDAVEQIPKSLEYWNNMRW